MLSVLHRRCSRFVSAFVCALIGLAVSSPGLAADQVGALTPERLRCECRDAPLGVDRAHPELSWILSADARDQMQSSYRILVATTPERLAAGDGDLWDTGKVDSPETFGIAYAGAPLGSHQRCYWKVKAWDRAGREGSWSDPQMWTVGPLDAADWQGKWIGYDELRARNDQPPVAPLEGADWICDPADSDNANARGGSRVFVGNWDLPEGVRLTRATLTVSADDNANVLVNGTQVALTREHKLPRTVDLVALLKPGRNEVRVAVRNSERGPTGLCVRAAAESSTGEEFVLVTNGDWKSADARGDAWRTSQLDDARAVAVIGPFGCDPWGKPAMRNEASAPPSYLRGAFDLDKKVKHATAYLAALGWADLTINGTPVNSDYFSSGWTDYEKRVYFRAYDVSEMVRQGENAWGVVLADGWYSGHIGWASDRDLYGKNPRVRAMLHVEFQDGSTECFATDESWVATAGPKTLADILIGEEYDATQEVAGWDEPGAAAAGASPVDVGAAVSPMIQWHPGPPVVEVGEFPAQSVNEVAPGVFVFDIGQNIAGVAKLKIKGRPGQRIQLRFAERLNDDGSLYTANLRLAKATDCYYCRGEGVEQWQPRQTFHGFQYVEVTGADGQLPLDTITGVALSSDTRSASDFVCSDEKLNRLYENVLWTQRANFIDVPTDCPQRDERLGWTGDAQVYVHTACARSDVQAFFRKWLIDLADAQREDGQFPKVAPVVLNQDDGGPAWADAGVICPWEIYQAYGDKAMLERQYPSMVRFVEFCRERSRDEVLPPQNFHCFGDWLSVNADTPREVIYTAYYARSVDLLRRSAEALGKTDDARKYGVLFERIKQAFQQEFVKPDGSIHGDTQCCYVLAIGYGLLSDEQRQLAAQRLVADIEARGWQLSTGFIGTKDLMLVLSEIGRTDVALRLLHQPNYPGWLFSISHGATSIWERWDGWTPERGFQNPDMNSFAHYSFGAVYGWMAENLGGIRAVEPAFGEIVIEPAFDPELDFCEVTYDTARGPICSKWRQDEHQRELSISVPPNVQATVRLADVALDEVLVDGKSLEAAGLVGETGKQRDGRDAVVVKVPSGEYRFTTRPSGERLSSR
ncbi:MAG: family 78 glycoside hydrolase catalytic domain [Planctomycetales bacterium]|nr:family 78 glycoside hydrolase catalytic domain [Planctomycetales bacterium]